ncbi:MULTISPECIES: rhomboid family intramembrane serine protease [Gordonia]|uniref:Rhomboid family intramembrane serine protease n=1 Tax=Gordonia cholesterolivorans TaxID=559625 RepID=A0ABN3H2E5_9ACTN|nr:rhomboid family intramembrane serine protease [Gordonia sihwensis]MBY4568529.1 rhomboid family intramembrane serine protease [Gordonia sihwensis]
MNEANATARVRTDAPVVDDSAAARRPVVTYGLIAVNLAAFIAVVLQAGGTSNLLLKSSIMQQGALVTGLGLENEYWRLLTSGFLHWSILHVAMNMISLYLIGADLERVLGPARYLAVYLIGLFGGSAAVVALGPELAATAGASGAIYGLLGALLIVVIRLKLPATTLITVIVLNVVLSLSIPGISIWAHFGGFVFGAASAAAIIWLPVKVLPPEKRTYQQVTRVGWIGLAALLVIALAIGTGFAAAIG